jgi:hypothetical protein
MRVGIISLVHESNTFAVTPTTIELFRRDSLLLGEACAASSKAACISSEAATVRWLSRCLWRGSRHEGRGAPNMRWTATDDQGFKPDGDSPFQFA